MSSTTSKATIRTQYVYELITKRFHLFFSFSPRKVLRDPRGSVLCPPAKPACKNKINPNFKACPGMEPRATHIPSTLQGLLDLAQITGGCGSVSSSTTADGIDGGSHTQIAKDRMTTTRRYLRSPAPPPLHRLTSATICSPAGAAGRVGVGRRRDEMTSTSPRSIRNRRTRTEHVPGNTYFPPPFFLYAYAIAVPSADYDPKWRSGVIAFFLGVFFFFFFFLYFCRF